MEILKQIKKSLKTSINFPCSYIEGNSEKRIYSEKISKVMNLLSEVFPDGKFQERHLNFSDFYKDLGQDFIINIKDNLDPLNQKFTIIEI